MHSLPRRALEHSFTRFAIIGLYNTLLDLLVFLVLYTLLGWYAAIANVLAFFIANIQSYILNKYWAFRHDRGASPSLAEYAHFLNASLFTLVAGTTVVTIGALYTNPIWLKLVLAIVLPVISYALYRMVFSRQSVSASAETRDSE